MTANADEDTIITDNIEDRSHYVREPTDWVGACSDVGKRHQINQDALALAVATSPKTAIVAVSDGVTSALASEIGSLLAARTACDAVQRAITTADDVDAAIISAFHDAHYAVLSGAPTAACTLIVAVIANDAVHLGNVGDSRAYWFSDDGDAELLSVDDSVAQARILLGMGRAEAEAAAHSHAITKWLGRQSSDVTPTLRSLEPATAGWLVVCSDGLWNYASDPATLREVFDNQLGYSSSPAQLAAGLVGWANEQGGRDNITVGVVRVGG